MLAGLQSANSAVYETREMRVKAESEREREREREIDKRGTEVKSKQGVDDEERNAQQMICYMTTF